MLYSAKYKSPLGNILLASDGEKLIGLWFEGQKYFASTISVPMTNKPDLAIFAIVSDWLEDYFAGKKPDVTQIPLAPIGGEFRQAVWRTLCQIPYGQTATYGEVAQETARQMGRVQTSPRAVGGAVGHNPISIIIPCHRVVGASGDLTGYAGGIERKIQLLKLEKPN